MRAVEVFAIVSGFGSGLDACATFRVLMKAVDALMLGRRLTLMDVARPCRDAERVRAPLKALDRLLSNSYLHGESTTIYAP